MSSSNGDSPRSIHIRSASVSAVTTRSPSPTPPTRLAAYGLANGACHIPISASGSTSSPSLLSPGLASELRLRSHSVMMGAFVPGRGDVMAPVAQSGIRTSGENCTSAPRVGLMESAIPLAKDLVVTSQLLAKSVTGEERCESEGTILTLAKDVASRARAIEELVMSHLSQQTVGESPLWSQLKEALTKVQAAVLSLISAVKAAFLNPFDLQASQNVFTACKHIAKSVKKFMSSVSVVEKAVCSPVLTGQESQPPTTNSVPSVATATEQTPAAAVTKGSIDVIAVTQDIIKAFLTSQQAISSQDESQFIEGIRLLVRSFNKFIEYSHLHHLDHAQRLRNMAMVIGQLSKSAFKFPSDPVYQSKFMQGILDAMVALTDILSATCSATPEAAEALKILSNAKTELLPNHSPETSPQLSKPTDPPVPKILLASARYDPLAAQHIIQLLTSTFPLFKKEWEEAPPSLVDSTLRSIERMVSQSSSDVLRKSPSAPVITGFSQKGSSTGTSQKTKADKVEEVLSMHTLAPSQSTVSLVTKSANVSPSPFVATESASVISNLLKAVLQQSNMLLRGERVSRMDLTKSVEEFMASVCSLLDETSSHGKSRASAIAALTASNSSATSWDPTQGPQKLDLLLDQLCSASMQLAEKIKTRPVEIDEAAVADCTGKNSKRVEELLLGQVYRFSNSLRFFVIHLFGALRLISGSGGTSTSTVPMLAAMMQLVAACQCLLSGSQTFLCHVGTLQCITSRDSGSMGSKIEEELELVSDADNLSNLWQEKTSYLFDTSSATSSLRTSSPDTVNSVPPLRAGTLNNIVNYLTSEDFYNNKFLNSCITTYQSFCSPWELLDKLRQRYQVPESINPQRAGKIKLRVGIVLKYWIENQFQDFDSKTIKELFVFADCLKNDGHVNLAKALHTELLKKEAELQTQLQLTAKESPIEIPPYSLLEVWESSGEGDVAQQLTMIDHSIFRSIMASELLDQNWSKKKTKHKSVNVLRMISRSNQVAFWVATTILSCPKVSDRARVCSKFINVAENLRKLCNFNGLMSILAGLTMSPISRLSLTFQAISKPVLNTFEKLQAVMNPTMSFKTYRENLRRSTEFCVPYLGTYLSDITFICDGNPDFVEGAVEPGGTPPKLINFKKREMVYTVIDEIRLYQQLPCTIVPQDPLHTLLQEIPHCDENQLYAVSLQLEPRKP
ncbi:Ras guanine nucleotide exchange factor [Pelomyxa schiedti]|nr:Ras guanine nucleotide exchange factor [Pelomyxa schiedti]